MVISSGLLQQMMTQKKLTLLQQQSAWIHDQSIKDNYEYAQKWDEDIVD